MTTTSTRPPEQHRSTPTTPNGRSRSEPSHVPNLLPLIACIVLLLAAVAPLATVFAGVEWGRPIGGALLVAIGLAWGLAQTRLPAVLAAFASALGWTIFVTVTFVPDTADLRFLPTAESRSALLQLADRGRDLVMTSVAPVAAEPALLLLAVTGSWTVAAVAAHLLFRGGHALGAIVAALVLFTFPLPVAAQDADATVLAAVFMAAVALVLFATSRQRAQKWGSLPSDGHDVRAASAMIGVVVAAAAIGAGLAFGTALPGADDPAVYRLRGVAGVEGGTNVTTNPMVGLRPSLTAQDRGPVMFVTSERPVYLRTTALDRYDELERWTRDRIVSTPITDGRLPQEIDPVSVSGEVSVDVSITTLRGLLVPVPYPPAAVSGATAGDFRYDPSAGTVTMRSGEELTAGDSYTVTALLPPPAERIAGLEGFAPNSSLTQLPGNVPDDVVALARRIVEDADATTPFTQALAIQDELRTWTYSLEPPAGHSGEAMQTFIETRIGYCEQFAGTMAVMLRSLDIPARVAVGFSPGTLVDAEADLWSVSNANAHAWVEVLFPGHGWVAFEPTPRSDGNVLVPDAATLAPEGTVTDASSADDELGDDPVDPESVPDATDDGLVPEVDEQTPTGNGLEVDITPALPDGGFVPGWTAVAATALLLLAGTSVAVAVRSRRLLPDGPRGRVLKARGRVEDLARGFGVRPRSSETDAEYLQRVGAQLGNAAAAQALAVDVAKARYASEATQVSAERSEAAAAALAEQVQGPIRRIARRTRGTASRGLRALVKRED